MNTLTKVDLARADRQPPVALSLAVKAIGTLAMASFVAGTTGDVWLASVILVGYPAAWSAAWIISK